MSRKNKVDGGIGPPAVKTLKNGTLIKSVTLPQPADLVQDFVQVSIKHKNILGEILVKPRGYRYGVVLDYPFLTKAEWGQIVALFNDFRRGYTLRFYPHDDEDYVHYDVVPVGGMAAPYFQGKYLGYSAKVELTGKDVLPFVPRETRWSYFSSSAETGYDPDEVSQFCDVDIDNYGFDELSHFSSGSTIASISS